MSKSIGHALAMLRLQVEGCRSASDHGARHSSRYWSPAVETRMEKKEKQESAACRDKS